MDFKFRPIQRWPKDFTKPGLRKRAPFGIGYDKTFRHLEREIKLAGGRHAIVQLAVSESEIRLDGRPRASASPTHPGVIVTFETKGGTLNFPCDAFTDWVGNVRAIGLALESLRRINRFGVVTNSEQYRGWMALPPARPVDEARRHAERLSVMAFGSSVHAQSILSHRDAYDTAFRAAAKLFHPDSSGEVRPEWHELQRAASVLKGYHEAGASA
jgi:hypothetical protein